MSPDQWERLPSKNSWAERDFQQDAAGNQLVIVCPVDRSTATVALSEHGEPVVLAANDTLTVSYRWPDVSLELEYVPCASGATALSDALEGKS